MRTLQFKSVLSCQLAAIVFGLAACGGGEEQEPEPQAPLAADARALALGGVKRMMPATTQLNIRAFGTSYQGRWPEMQVRVNERLIANLTISAPQPTDHFLTLPTLKPGDRIDLVFTNADGSGSEWRTLGVKYISDGTHYALASSPQAQIDFGRGAAAFDGRNVQAGQSLIRGDGALRLIWPESESDPDFTRDAESSRFLQQASFGPTVAELQRLRQMSFRQWIDEQMALPYTDTYLDDIQGIYDSDPENVPPRGRLYTPDWVGQKFWQRSAQSPDQLRQRVAFALQQILVVSQSEANLFYHSRTFADYIDLLHRQAFGNYRDLLEGVALHPAMGVYLSHIRNQKEDPSRFRQPDENFARELMQLFTIGLHQLNPDGSVKIGLNGKPIETYNNADVMAMARVFTGFSWGYDDAHLDEHHFRWGIPDGSGSGSARVEIRRMKAYPGQSSPGEKRLLEGRPGAIIIPAGTAPEAGVRLALDALFRHPNTAPFVSRQLIQRLTTSNPSPAYVERVAQVFADNGAGVRGDLGAVVRAILLDSEARDKPAASFGKVREPVVKVSHMMRSLGASSVSGRFLVTNETAALGQRPFYSPSVFNFFRPGFVPQIPGLAEGVVLPEMQIVDEATVAEWINRAESMLEEGLGWFGNRLDIRWALQEDAAVVRDSPLRYIDRLDRLFLAGSLSPHMRKALLDAMLGIEEDANDRDLRRARTAIFLVVTSPQYFVQR